MVNMAFFPNFLKRCYQLHKQVETRAPFPEDHIPKIKEIIEFYRNQEDFNEPHLFLCTNDPDDNDEIANEALYEYCTNEDLRKTFAWSSKKIILLINIDNYLSINVYTRIVTSMLNKLVDEGRLSKQLNIYYHDNLVCNVHALIAELRTEDIPFLLDKVRLLTEFL